MDKWTKQYATGKEARQLYLEGVKKQAALVGATLGPSGKFVAIARPTGAVTSTKDGVTVCRDVVLEGIPGVGARLSQEAAAKTMSVAGDGTTTATVLIERLFNLGLKATDGDGHPVLAVKRGMEKAVHAVCDPGGYIDRFVKPVHGPMLDQVGTISANNDPVIGKLIGDAMRRAGKNGVITVEQSRTAEHSIETIEGMQFNEGFVTPEFVTDPLRMEAVLQDPYILLLDRPLVSLQGLGKFLDRFTGQGRPLLIICEELGGEALPTLVVNKQQQRILSCVVKIPGNLGSKAEFLKDIEAFVGGVAILMETGISTEKIDFFHLGQASKVVVGRNTTTIYGGKGTKVDYRVNQIRGYIGAVETHEVEKEKLQERLAKLSGGLTTIKIGSTTDAEMKEKIARVEDCMFATKCAVEGGVVPGGGFCLARCSKLILYELEKTSSPAEEAGVMIVAQAMLAPAKLIAKYAGYEEAVEHALEDDDLTWGLNSLTGESGNLFDLGVIDPAKVVRTALQDAVSVAEVMLSTEAVILDVPGEVKGPIL